MTGGRIATAVPANSVPIDLLGASRQFLVVPNVEPASRSLAFVATIEDNGGTIDLVLGEGPERTLLAGLALQRGECDLYGNVPFFGHGKTMPSIPLGSGDGAVQGQDFFYEAGIPATRPSAFEEGGVAPELAVTVAGREYRRVASLEDIETEDEAVYDVSIDVEGRTRFHFPRRLATGIDNVMLSRLRVGAGAIGNTIKPFTVTKLAKANEAVTALVQPVAPQMGRDLQSIDQLKADQGDAIRWIGRAATARDFATLAERHAGVWQAAARPIVLGYGGGRTQIEVTLVPAGGGAVTPLVEPVRRQLESRAAPNISVLVQGFVPVRLAVSAQVRLKSGYLPDNALKAELETLLLASFGLEARPLSQPLFVSSLVAALEAHPVVERATVSAEAAPLPDGTIPALNAHKNADGSLQTVRARANETIFIESGDLTIDLHAAAGGASG